MTLFRRWQWQWLAPSRVNATRGDVGVASRFAEVSRLLTEPLTDEDRDKAEAATRAYLASVEAGC